MNSPAAAHQKPRYKSSRRKRNEQVDVIWHDHIAANGNVVLLCIFAEGTKGIVDFIACKKKTPG